MFGRIHRGENATPSKVNACLIDGRGMDIAGDLDL
jgi:hypothetical protein